MLRIGEANASPLPPPPNSQEKPPSRPASLHHEELTLGATGEEIQEAALEKPDVDHHPETEQTQEKPHKRTLASGILGFFRGTTASGVESKRGIDRLRATVGSRHAKNRVGVLRHKGKMITPIGPVSFDARYKGKHGTVIIDSTKEPALLYFTTETPFVNVEVENRKAGSVLFTMPVNEIQEMRKLGGMGWKGKLVVGWALGSKEVVDGLLITGTKAGQKYQLTAMGTRNQLFNRLVAIDGQVWATC